MSDIFCLTDERGGLLPPALQATVLAKYSRSSLSAREIVKSLTTEEADKFQDKWVVQYGHNSVAELATVPICFEGISMIASKVVESFPRAAYSEKSTRYQEFSENSFISPPGAPETMRHFASNFYSAYKQLMVDIYPLCASKLGMDPNDPKTAKDRTVKARVFDNVRYLLPAGTGTNVAAVMNMRDARQLITLLRGHENAELKQLGDKVHDAVIELAPTLVRHTEPDYFTLTEKWLGPVADCCDGSDIVPYVKLITHGTTNDSVSLRDVETETRFKERVKTLYGMEWDVFCKYMQTRPSHSEVPKVFRDVDLTIEAMMDYGAYRDLQRHRRCTQFSEPLSLSYGYVVPEDIKDTQFEKPYRKAMEKIWDYQDENVVHNPNLMQYMIPMGYLYRTQFKMDLAQLYYIVEQRSKPQGHISYRQIACSMYDCANNFWPELMQWCRVTPLEVNSVHH